MNFKYIPKAQIIMAIIVIILLIIMFLIFILEIFILYFVMLFWLLFMVIYEGFVMKKGVELPSDEEFKELLEILNKTEVIDYIRELVSKRLINNIHHNGIEIDSKFNTNFTQKKGWDYGQFRDSLFYHKIEKLYFIIINEKN